MAARQTNQLTRRSPERGAGRAGPDEHLGLRRRLLALLAPILTFGLVANAVATDRPRPWLERPEQATLPLVKRSPPSEPRYRSAPSAPRLREDPQGPFFTRTDGEVRRLEAARPRGKVALIFDDGPGAQTSDVVGELRRAEARATFFLIGGEVRAHPRRVRELATSGMEIGNHSFSHHPMTSRDPEGQAKEIESAQQEIEQAGGGRPRLFRPPQVTWDRTTARAVSAARMVGVLHTVETRDYQRPGSAAIVRSAQVAKAGDVIALHDAGGDRSDTIAAIRPMVEALRERGLQPVTVSELLGYPPPRPNGRDRTATWMRPLATDQPSVTRMPVLRRVPLRPLG